MLNREQFGAHPLSDIEKRFTLAMHNIYKRCKDEIGYRPTELQKMIIADGGLVTAKRLINALQQSPGYTRLQMEGRLDLSVEAVVVENTEWRTLFTVEEIEKAMKRLKKNEYKPRMPS